MSEEVQLPVRYLVADTETCGLGQHKKMCEVAIREIDPITLAPIREWLSLIDPQHPIQEEAQAVHGISDEMVADAPTKEEYRHEILKGEFDNSENIIICHNVAFDASLLADLMPIHGTICTLTWARRLMPTEVINHKLATLREHFGYPEGEAHRAMADVATTVRVLGNLLHRSGMTLAQFARNGEHKVHTVPWGQYKGRLLISLPFSYLAWLWNRDELEANMRDSVKDALTKLHKDSLTACGVKSLRANTKIEIEVER